MQQLELDDVLAADAWARVEAERRVAQVSSTQPSTSRGTDLP